jgi:hypothetical protein
MIQLHVAKAVRLIIETEKQIIKVHATVETYYLCLVTVDLAFISQRRSILARTPPKPKLLASLNLTQPIFCDRLMSENFLRCCRERLSTI